MDEKNLNNDAQVIDIVDENAEKLVFYQEEKEQLLIEVQRLKEQNRVLVSELNAYTQQVGELKKENNDLSAELQSVLRRSNSQLLQAKDRRMFELDRQCQEQESQALRDKQRMDELMRSNNELKEENKQYQMIVDKLEKEELSLENELRIESGKLHELQDQYNDLDEEYNNQQELVKRTSSAAHELESELTKLKHTEDVDNVEPINHFDDLDNKYIGSGGAPGKTLRINPLTLRLPDTSIVSERSDPYEAFDEEFETDNEQYEAINVVKEQLQIEFDDKLCKEKGKLIEKHNFEISALSAQIIEYKKKLILTVNELRESQIEGEHRYDIRKRRVIGWGFASCCQDASLQ